MSKQKIPTEKELYYEYSFQKHCYKFERADIGYICVTNENKQAAFESIISQIKDSLQATKTK